MKLSCLPVSYFDQIVAGAMPVEAWAREAAGLALRLGASTGPEGASGQALDAVDLSCLFLQSLADAYLDEMRESIEGAGMRVAMLTTYPDFTHPDPGKRQRQIEQERAYIAAAGRLGSELVRITAGQAHPGLDEEAGIRRALDGLTACEEAAQKAGVRLVLENHGKPGCWQYTDFDQPTHIFLALAEGIRGTTIGINFDTANPLAYGDDPLPILDQVIDQVVSIHAAETAVRGALEPVVLGTGLVPFKQLFSCLKGNGFDGWICIEEASRSGPLGVEQAVRFVRQAWESA